MNICLSVCIKHQEADWLTPPLSDVLRRCFIELVPAESSDELLVMTDSGAVEKLAGDCGVTRVRRVSIDPGMDREVQLADALVQWFGADEPVAVLDHKNPMLTSEALDSARQEFNRNTALPLVSVTCPEDHPVQLRELIEVVDAGMMVFFDDGANADKAIDDGFRITRKFPFDWRTVAAATEGVRLFAPHEDGLVESEGAAYSHEIWIREDVDMARIAYDGRDIEPGVPGLAVGEGVSALSEAIDGQFCFRPAVRDVRVSLVPFSETGINDSVGFSLTDTDGEITLSMPERGVSGFIYSVEKVSGEGDFDYQRFFSPSNGMWKIDTQRGKNGDKLYGRQSFPDVYELDRTVFMGTPSQLRSLTTAFAEGKLRGIVLWDNPIVIRTQIDFIRYKVRMREAAGLGARQVKHDET